MQQQQHANYDLLAVFSDETKADAAEEKLRKAGFADEEVFRLAAGTVVGGQFREHGPNRDRSSVFLQTQRSGPNPATALLLAIVFGLLLGAVMFGATEFAIKSISVLQGTLAGVIVGIILGTIVGFLRRGPVRGAIGQDLSKVNTPARKPVQEAGSRTVVAVRLPDPENVSRKSKARAILLNNGGKIDRTVGG